MWNFFYGLTLNVLLLLLLFLNFDDPGCVQSCYSICGNVGLLTTLWGLLTTLWVALKTLLVPLTATLVKLTT